MYFMQTVEQGDNRNFSVCFHQLVNRGSVSKIIRKPFFRGMNLGKRVDEGGLWRYERLVGGGCNRASRLEHSMCYRFYAPFYLALTSTCKRISAILQQAISF